MKERRIIHIIGGASGVGKTSLLKLFSDFRQVNTGDLFKSSMSLLNRDEVRGGDWPEFEIEVTKISLFLFDGQGIAHSIGFGLASHFGVLFNKPSIGVTKKALFGEYSAPSRGSYTYLKHPKTKSIIGYCVSMGGESFFMSPGHRITLKRSLDVVRMVSGKGYLPHPIRIVHEKANKIAREHWIAYKKML